MHSFSHQFLTLLLTRSFQNILINIQHKPNGYIFLQSLPLRGKHSQKVMLRQWARVVISFVFNKHFKDAVVMACFDDDGIVDKKATELYAWTLRYIFDSKEKEMFSYWVYLKQLQGV